MKTKKQEPKKRKRGGQFKYESPEEMEAAIDAYFAQEDCSFTQSGLALALGFNTRKSLYDYAERDGFNILIKKAMLRIEDAYEKRLQGTTPTGSIFALKNMGWTDKQDVSLAGQDGGPLKIQVTVKQPIPDGRVKKND